VASASSLFWTAASARSSGVVSYVTSTSVTGRKARPRGLRVARTRSKHVASEPSENQRETRAKNEGELEK
jgi:hypothetical protein